MKTIGIVIRIEFLDSAWKYFCNESYIQICQKYHWQPILLCSIEDANTLVSICDALLLPGGYDIASQYYQQIQHEQATLYTSGMDHLEFTILDAFVKAKKPILGICRGMQVINVYFKGTLHQHIDIAKHEKDHMHPITVKDDSIFALLLTKNQSINSYHHQCVDTIGNHLQVGVYSLDHHIEAFAHESLPILGVQWHPEKMKDDQILPYFFDILARSCTF